MDGFIEKFVSKEGWLENLLTHWLFSFMWEKQLYSKIFLLYTQIFLKGQSYKTIAVSKISIWQ